MSTALVRFAPSPTGWLHVGNARTALLNALFAKARGGRFSLRLDDTDAERSEQRFATAIEDDLAWLGIVWDDVIRQSERLERYRAAFEQLSAAGRVYPCYETPDELAAKRQARQARGLAPVYDRAALALDDAARTRLEAAGSTPHWRFKLEASEAVWDDLVRGSVRIAAGHISDPVVARADGQPTYALASVVDDVETGVTHVIRGEDHVSNTPVQIELARALGAEPPTYAHLPLLHGLGGENLSKRTGGALTLADLRSRGVEPLALASLLARLGTSEAIEPAASLDELAAGFDFAKISRAAPSFDEPEVFRLNARLLHAMPFADAAPRLAALGLADAHEAFWLIVRGNLERLDDAKLWGEVCFGAIAPVIEDAGFLDQAAAELPAPPWDEATWAAWTGRVKAATGRKGRALYHPLRLALTGLEHGPELKNLLPVIGPERARSRLAGRTA
jgi:glutamyl-tRNA synthetase